MRRCRWKKEGTGGDRGQTQGRYAQRVTGIKQDTQGLVRTVESEEQWQQSLTMVDHNHGKEVAATSSKTKRPEDRTDSGQPSEKSFEHEKAAESPLNSFGKTLSVVLHPVKKPLQVLKLCEHQRVKNECKAWSTAEFASTGDRGASVTE